MKVFISWSGDRSKKVAELLQEWLKCVLQALDPWISSKDIDRGAFWFSEVTNALNDSVNGIICLTKENLKKPWILFEAGALSKGITAARVCTFLIDIQPIDVDEPLSQFNHTLPDRQGMLSLVKTLNNRLGDCSLSGQVLSKVFDTYYPQFQEEFKSIIESTPDDHNPSPVRDNDKIMEEILYTVRSLDKRVRSLENPPSAVFEKMPSQLGIRSKIPRRPMLENSIISYLNQGMDPNQVCSNITKDYQISNAAARTYLNEIVKKDIVFSEIEKAEV